LDLQANQKQHNFLPQLPRGLMPQDELSF
jgi:hypothetical protein